ncbi:MAG: tetratricopeptide repeat protein, partial [Leptospiraceae bacterium]|nr:tetratricopeptide repeat protein [Leptospiraceae bacterium]
MPSLETKTSDRILKLVLVCVFMLFIFFPFSAWWNQHKAHELQETVSQFLQDENWQAAEQYARKWTKLDPENSDAWLDLAEAYRQQNKYAETADALGQISDKDPRVLKSLAVRTDLLLSELQDPIRAIENCERILKIDPRADVARQRLIYINAMMLRRWEMVDQIRQAVKLQCEPPEAYVYLLLADSLNFSNGAPLVNEWLKKNSGNEALEVALAIYVASSSSQKSLSLANGKIVSGHDETLVTDCLKKYPH